ncbi:MAG: ABC-three component system middle component 6 [bacterium]
MILPSKHISQENALLTLGAKILIHLDEPRTISAVWEKMYKSSPGNYDWFVLALDLLYTINCIEIIDGLLRRRTLE